MNRSDWLKNHQRLVDQRGVELPPTWVARREH